MELKKLLKNTSFLAGTSVVQFLAGIIRSKINAVLLGTTGVGIVNQLTFLTGKMAEFTTLSMSEAVVKQIAESKEDDQLKSLVCASLKSYIILVFSFTIVTIILFVLFKVELSVYILGDTKYLPYFFVGLFSFPILILNSIPFAILKGFKDIKSISFAKIGIILSNLVIFIPLLLIFGLKGAVSFVPISYIVTLLFNYWLTRKYHLIRLNISLITVFNAKLETRFIKELMLFSSFGLFVGTFSIVSEFICRSIVVSQLGVDSIGLYSPINTWAGLFLGFIIPSFSTYLYPRFAETKTNMEIKGILNDALRLSTFTLMPLLFLAIPFRYFFIELFYSKEFLEAAKYLPFHFVGLVFSVWFYIFTQSMSPTGRIKQHAFFYTLFLFSGIVVTYFTIPIWGLYGWMLKHIISPILFFIVYAVYSNLSMDFIFNKSNLIAMSYLFGGSILLLLTVLWSKYIVLSYLLGPTLTLISWFILMESEKTFIIKKISWIRDIIFKR